MPSVTNELAVAAWTSKEVPATLELTRFVLSPRAFMILQQWCQEQKPRATRVPAYIVLAGLSEILAFFVPEIAYMENVADIGGEPRRNLALFVLGNATGDAALRRRVESAMNIWLGTIYPEKPAEMRAEIAATARNDDNWSAMAISTRLREHAGVCAVPQDAMMYSVATVRAASALAGASVAFGSGDERTLIAETPRSSPFRGIELVAFPPLKDSEGRNFYSEVVVVQAATFPDRKGNGVHILATPHIRNWGPVEGYDVKSSAARSLDVFVPPVEQRGGYRDYRHMSFAYKASVDNWDAVHRLGAPKEIAARWESRREERVFDLLGRLAGVDKLARSDQTQPVAGESGFWVLPRLAPGSGDRYLAGGSGVGWSDRLDIGNSIDSALERIGLQRAASMRRIHRRMPVSSPFPRKQGVAAERRAALKDALHVIASNGELDVMVLHGREQTPGIVRQEIVRFFGDPDGSESDLLTWTEGLTIRLTSAPAAVLAEMVREGKLSEVESAGKTGQQREQMQKARQEQNCRDALERMQEYVRSLRGGRTGIAWAILEMADSVKGKERDPYVLARQALARYDVLPQVVLTKEGMAAEKYGAAVGDLIRMTGVLPIFDEALALSPAALTLIQRNAQDRSASSTASQAFPLAVRVCGGRLECALATDEGTTEWMPYARAVLRILSGSYARFSRGHDDGNTARLHTFFATALEEINRQGQALVLLDGDTMGRAIPALQNQYLTYDELAIGARRYAPRDLPNLRLLRIVADAGKLPSYHHAGDTQWPTGLFSWGDGHRATYGLKRKPASAKTTGRASVISRHIEPGDNSSADDLPRRIALMDEICVLLAQPNDNFEDLAVMAHRLRQVHTQYGDDTRLPYPLHELKLLRKAAAP